MWAILSALHKPATHTDRVSNYVKYVTLYDWSDLHFPIDPSTITSQNQIMKFINKNKIRIDILAIGDPEIYTKFQTDYQVSLACTKSVLLLFFTSGDISHFVCVNNLSALMRDKAHNKYHYCLNCWSSYKSVEYLNAHRKDCMVNTACKIILPDKDKAFVEFKNYHKKLRLPFVIYADFEAFIINDNHKPCSIAMTLISDYPDIIKPETLMFKGDNLIFDFLTKLKHWQNMFYEAFKTDKYKNDTNRY